jgi:hypothetical protein
MKFILILIAVLALILIYFGLRLLLKHDSKTLRRLAYTISALWLLIPFLFILATKSFRIENINEQEWIVWTVGALIPNILIWSIVWVLNGLFSPTSPEKPDNPMSANNLPNTSSQPVAKKSVD